MENFEKYWEENKEKYISLAQEQAKKEFMQLNNNTLNNLDIQEALYSATVEIDSDDDFTLDLDPYFTVSGKSFDVVVFELIQKLKDIKLLNSKEWSVTDNQGNKISSDKSSSWFYIRDEAIKELEQGNMNISLGGNQTINIDISKIANKNKNKPQ